MRSEIDLTPEQRSRRQIERRKALAYKRLVKLTSLAITRIELCLTDKMANEYPSIMLAAAKDVLDRAGLKSTDKIEIDVNVTTLADTIRARRLQRLGVVVDGQSDI